MGDPRGTGIEHLCREVRPHVIQIAPEAAVSSAAVMARCREVLAARSKTTVGVVGGGGERVCARVGADWQGEVRQH